MFYNTRNQELLNSLPLNGSFEDGTLVQGLELADAETQKLCGFLPVKSNSPIQPENTMEDVSQRVVTIEEDGVVVTRVWVSNPEITPIVPETISARQVRLWLVQNNISLSSVQNVIDSIEDNYLRQKTQIEWEYAPYIERNHPLIESLGSSLGLTSQQIDQGFLVASEL